MVLSEIIPRLTGTAWATFIQREIFDKVGLEGAFMNVTAARETGRGTDGTFRLGVNTTACGQQWRKSRSLSHECLGEVRRFGAWTDLDTLSNAGAGGVILSPRDMVSNLRGFDISV